VTPFDVIDLNDNAKIEKCANICSTSHYGGFFMNKILAEHYLEKSDVGCEDYHSVSQDDCEEVAQNLISSTIEMTTSNSMSDPTGCLIRNDGTPHFNTRDYGSAKTCSHDSFLGCVCEVPMSTDLDLTKCFCEVPMSTDTLCATRRNTHNYQRWDLRMVNGNSNVECNPIAPTLKYVLFNPSYSGPKDFEGRLNEIYNTLYDVAFMPPSLLNEFWNHDVIFEGTTDEEKVMMQGYIRELGAIKNGLVPIPNMCDLPSPPERIVVKPGTNREDSCDYTMKSDEIGIVMIKQIISDARFGIICDSDGNKLAKVERPRLISYGRQGECSGEEHEIDLFQTLSDGRSAEEKCATACNTGEYGGFVITRDDLNTDDNYWGEVLESRGKAGRLCFCEVPQSGDVDCIPNNVQSHPYRKQIFYTWEREKIPIWLPTLNQFGSPQFETIQSSTDIPVDRYNYNSDRDTRVYCWDGDKWVQQDEYDYFTCGDGYVISVDPFVAIPANITYCEINLPNEWSLGRGYLTENNCYSPADDNRDYDLCTNTTVTSAFNEASIVEVSKEDYVAKQTTNGQPWESQTPFVTPKGQTRYFMCKEDNVRFSTSCTPKTFGIVTARNSSGICETQCAKWKKSLEHGFKDGSVDVELTGTTCDEMTNNVRPVISNACPKIRRRLGGPTTLDPTTLDI
jgi:hypothetical protein